MNPSPGGRGSFLTASGDRSGVVGLWTRAVPAGAILWRGDHARISMVLMGNDRTPPVRRTTVAEAARLLGISAEAVRGRIRRGTLPVEREEGTVYVLLEGVAEDRTDADRPRTTGDQPGDRPQSDSAALISQMRGEVAYLREQLAEEREARRRADTLLAQLMQRIPELEPPAEGPPDERGSPETAEPGSEGVSPRPSPTPSQGSVPRRPWWRRVFGG